MDEHLKAARDLMALDRLSPPWDTEKESALLAEVLRQAEETPGTSAAPWWKDRAVTWGATGALVAAAATVALVFFSGSVEKPAPAEQAAVQAPVEPRPSELNFAAGTRALLDPGSQVTTLTQTDTFISLRQQTGLVAYEVNPDAHQRFQVLAEDVIIEVIGTRFSVGVTDAGVEVEVTRGAVSVKTEERSLVLRPGESVLLAPGREAPTPEGDPVSPPAPKEERPAAITLAALLAEADEARSQGDLARAERALRRASRDFSGDPRSTTALFSLGRVQRAQGKAGAAAQTFAEVRRRSPGALSEDALAEEAVSLAQAGQSATASARAAEYIAAHPDGIHRARLEKLIQKK